VGLETVVNLLDKYNLPWLLLAVLTWVLVLLTCSLSFLWQTMPVGIWTMITGGIIEQFFIYHKFWTEKFIMIHLGELDLFVLAGPFFTLGILLIRFLPRNRWLVFLSILAWSVVATFIEIAALKLGFLAYDPEKWWLAHSLGTYYFSLMSALGFFCVYSNKLIYRY